MMNYLCRARLFNKEDNEYHINEVKEQKLMVDCRGCCHSAKKINIAL